MWQKVSQWLSLLYKFTYKFIYFLFLSDKGPTLETFDHTIRIGSTPTFLYFDLYLHTQPKQPTTIITLTVSLLNSQVIVGKYDDILPWPVNPRFTFTLLDQRDSARDRRNITVSFDPHWIARPTPERQLGKGARKFVLQSVACSEPYSKNDALFIRFLVKT